MHLHGPGSSVGIATGYGMDGLGIESRWGARFFAPVQTGPRDNPASCTMGTGSFPGVKSGRGVTRIPLPSNAVVMKGWSYISTLPMGRTACREPQCLYKGALYLTSVPVQGCTLPYLSACTRVHLTLPQCLYKGALYI